MTCCYLKNKNICMLNNEECELETPDGSYRWEEYYCPDCGNTYRYLQLGEDDEYERD